MATRYLKPVINNIEENVLGKTVADVVGSDVVSIKTHKGKLIRREEFGKTPIPEGFNTYLSDIEKGWFNSVNN